jgi:hypothetical protein
VVTPPVFLLPRVPRRLCREQEDRPLAFGVAPRRRIDASR